MLKKSFLLIIGLFLFCTTYGSNKNQVLKLTVNGVIDPIVADYIAEGIEKAEEIQAKAVLIELNTPGGLLEATRSAIQTMVNTEIPIIVYVTPRGARATSAGVFITIAADVAAMTPETHIGAAHPVMITGDSPQREFPSGPEKKEDATKNKDKKSEKKPGSVMDEKMVSDAAAYIRALAAERGRNADWAERAVRESVSLTAKEALEQNVINDIASSEVELLTKINGRKIKKKNKEIVLDTSQTLVQNHEMSWSRQLLHKLSHPNIAYILLTLGTLGLISEITTPGFGFGGIAGTICLLLAFLALQVLPINTVGLILVVLGLALIIADLFVPSHGILTFGGLICFGIGSFLLIDVHPSFPYPRISLWLILPTVTTMGLFFGVALKQIMKIRTRPVEHNMDRLHGKKAEVRQKIAPSGLVFLEGELWSAKADNPIAKGEMVSIVGHEGNTLIVQKSKKGRD